MPQPVISVLAGPSLDSLTPLTVNSSEPHSISSPSSGFSGRVAVRIVDYLGPEGVSQPKTELKDGATMSIVVQGKWEEEVEADEVVSIFLLLFVLKYWEELTRSLETRCLETAGRILFAIHFRMELQLH